MFVNRSYSRDLDDILVQWKKSIEIIKRISLTSVPVDSKYAVHYICLFYYYKIDLRQDNVPIYDKLKYRMSIMPSDHSDNGYRIPNEWNQKQKSIKSKSIEPFFVYSSNNYLSLSISYHEIEEIRSVYGWFSSSKVHFKITTLMSII